MEAWKGSLTKQACWESWGQRSWEAHLTFPVPGQPLSFEHVLIHDPAVHFPSEEIRLVEFKYLAPSHVAL